MPQGNFEPPAHKVEPVLIPAPCDVSVFQAELSRRGGKNPHGDDILKIFWGPSSDCLVRFGGNWVFHHVVRYGTLRKPIGWDVSLGTVDDNGEANIVCLPLDFEKWPAEFARLRDDPTVIPIKSVRIFDIAQPLFFVFEWVPGETVCDGWDEWKDKVVTTRIHDPITGKLIPVVEKVDMLGDAPRHGVWIPVWAIRDEEGGYREPCDRDLAVIDMARQLREQDPILGDTRPGMKAATDVVEKLALSYLEADIAEEEKERQASRSRLEDIIASRVDRLRLTPKSFPTVSRSNAGTPPNE